MQQGAVPTTPFGRLQPCCEVHWESPFLVDPIHRSRKRWTKAILIRSSTRSASQPTGRRIGCDEAIDHSVSTLGRGLHYTCHSEAMKPRLVDPLYSFWWIVGSAWFSIWLDVCNIVGRSTSYKSRFEFVNGNIELQLHLDWACLLRPEQFDWLSWVHNNHWVVANFKKNLTSSLLWIFLYCP